MPRAGGVYSAPPGTSATPNTTVASAPYNALVADLVADANAARPVTAGGTGSTNAYGANDALNNQGADIASAATTNLALATGVYVNITGTVPISALGTLGAGVERETTFTGILTLTHNATSLILPGAANIVTAAGDVARWRSLGSGNWKCVDYLRASGLPLLNTFPSPTVTDTLTLKSTDAGAGAAPIADLFRDSASPAASDLLAQVQWTGRDSAANKELYAAIVAKILDPTSTSEDAVLVFSSIIAGALAARFNIGAGIYTEGVTGGDKGAGTINAATVYDDGVKLGNTLGTPTASTSGTSIDYTTLPAGLTRITVNFAGVSTTGTSAIGVQLGTSGGIEATNYIGGTESNAPASSALTTMARIIDGSAVAARIYSGVLVFTLLSPATNTWCFQGSFSADDASRTYKVAGYKSLAGTLDRLRITTVGGTDTFDAGSVNILYE